jgi:hypothetical protein
LSHLRKVGQTLALEARSPSLPRTARWGRLVESGIQPETGDEGDRIRELAAAIEELQGSVSPIGYGNYLTLRIPAPQ